MPNGSNAPPKRLKHLRNLLYGIIFVKARFQDYALRRGRHTTRVIFSSPRWRRRQRPTLERLGRYRVKIHKTAELRTVRQPILSLGSDPSTAGAVATTAATATFCPRVFRPFRFRVLRRPVYLLTYLPTTAQKEYYIIIATIIVAIITTVIIIIVVIVRQKYKNPTLPLDSDRVRHRYVDRILPQ